MVSYFYQYLTYYLEYFYSKELPHICFVILRYCSYRKGKPYGKMNSFLVVYQFWNWLLDFFVHFKDIQCTFPHQYVLKDSDVWNASLLQELS